MSSDLDLLLRDVITKWDLDALKQALEVFSDNLYRVGDDQTRQILENGLSKEIAVIFEADAGNNLRLKMHLREINEGLKIIPTVKIITAIPLTKAMLRLIHDQLKTGTQSNLVLETQVDPEILGGLIFVINGKYSDYSVSRKWDNLWEETVKEVT